MTDPVKRAEELLAEDREIPDSVARQWIRNLCGEVKHHKQQHSDGLSYNLTLQGYVSDMEAEVKALRGERDLARSFLEDEQKKSADWWSAYCTLKEEHEGMESELTSLRGVVEKVREHTTKRLSDPPCSVYQEGKHDEANRILSLLPKVT